MKVAVVVRVNPLRVQLTVPEQFVSAVAVGQPVTFEVDAYPGPPVRRARCDTSRRRSRPTSAR